MVRTSILAVLAALAISFLPNALGEAGGAAPSAPKPNSPTYTKLVNYTGQWSISMFIRPSPSNAWAPHVCNTTTFGAACNQPVITGFTDTEVSVNFTLQNASAPFRTWKNGTPYEVIVRLDYAAISQVDRGWRKKNQAYPGHGWHAKWTLKTFSWVTSGAGIWDLSEADEVTDALLYPEVCVLCHFADGTSDYCQCDRKQALTIETAVINSITPAMRAAAIAMSVFSPVFLIIYSVSDSLYYKRTGRSLRIAHA